MSDEYLRPQKAVNVEFIERKSRFIGHVTPVSDESEALEFIKRIKKEHKNATHNVYAYSIRRNGEKPSVCRHSDDGEPSGTAGVPLMDVFTKRNVENYCAVATRYFGGILLGSGGLVRAYAKCAAAALEASGIVTERVTEEKIVRCTYGEYASVRRELEEMGAENIETVFEDTVLIKCRIISRGE